MWFIKRKNIKTICMTVVFLLVGVLGFTSCEKSQAQSNGWDVRVIKERDTDISQSLTYEGSMELEYAENFAVDYYTGGSALITMINKDRFLIVPKETAVPEDLSEDIIVLPEDMSDIYLVASAAMDMFRELDAIENIRFSGQEEENWCIEEAREAMAEGDILYAGKYNMPDYELIVSEGCSLAIENNMIYHTPEVIEKLESFDIPVLVDYSSYESHPLGRVEWVKLYGVLLGRRDAAETAFEKQTAILKSVQNEESTGKTVAFFYINASGAVNVRQSTDYVPKMIELAGGEYIFSDLNEGNHKSSMNMQFEEFYEEAKDADYLVYNSTIDGELTTIEDLLDKNEMLKDFKAVQEGNVWCTTSDLYQQSMSLGKFIEDIHNMLTGADEGEIQYMYLLP